MTIKTSEAYQNRKQVYIYLATNDETHHLQEDAKKATKTDILLHLETWQIWGKKPISEAWEGKTADWIIWPHQTSRHERWVVLVINTKENKAAIHTASKTADAKAEEVEIINYLGELKGFTITPHLDVDDGASNKRTDKESALLAILYIKEILTNIKNGIYNYTIDNSVYDEEDSKGIIPLKSIETEYDQLSQDIAKLKTIKDLEDNQEKHTPTDLLTDDQKKALAEATKSKDEIDQLKKDLAKETAEKEKTQQDFKDLKDAGKLAAKQLKTLQAENTTLKTENDALKKGGVKPTPAPDKGTPAPDPVIKGSDEWKAVAELMTETKYYNLKDLLNKITMGTWTDKQKAAIKAYLKAVEKNTTWIIGRVNFTY